MRHTKDGREREVPFGEACRIALLQYLARRGELAHEAALLVTHLGERLTRNRLYKCLQDPGEKAEVANVHPHRLRHSAATLALREGMDLFALQRMLDHSSLTRVRRYAQVTQNDLVAQHRAASPGDRFL